MIAFLCSNCGAELRVKTELAGTTGKCPRCKQKVEAPYDTSAREDAPTPPNRSTHSTDNAADAESSNPDFESDSIVSEQDLAFLDPPELPDEIGRMGNYRILKVLGTGGMGIVFQAEDEQLGRQVALKSLKAELASRRTERERFLREARSAAAIDHEHVITIYQVGEHNSVPFLAMKLLRGQSLEDRLNERGGRLPLPEVLRIGQEVAEGLEAAHASGLIHRDIKPANIWLEEGRDWVRIVDFGLARESGQDGHLTQAGMILGTPAYMAPEQAHAEPLDCRCDLFSLGCVLYRMSTGELPFKGKNSMAMLLALTSKTPPAPHTLVPALPFAFSELVMNLLEKNAAQRPASARIAWDQLERIKQAPTGKSAAGTVRKSVPAVSVSTPTPPPPTPSEGRARKPQLPPKEEELEEVVEAVNLGALAEIESSGTNVRSQPLRVAKAKPKSAPISRTASEDDELERKVMKLAKWVAAAVFALILFLIVRHVVVKMMSNKRAATVIRAGSVSDDWTSIRRSRFRLGFVADARGSDARGSIAEMHYEKTFPSMARAGAIDFPVRRAHGAARTHRHPLAADCRGEGQA